MTGQMFTNSPVQPTRSRKMRVDAAREASRHDLREEGLDPDHAGSRRSGPRRRVERRVAVKLGPGEPVFRLEHERLERRSLQPA